MRTLTLSRTVMVLGLLNTALMAAADPHPAWQQTQTLEVPSPGLVRFEVPLNTLGASQSRLDDVRLVSPGGIETPYVVEWPLFGSVESKSVKSFHASLQNQVTMLDLETGTTKNIGAVILETSASNLIKAATVEGSNDGVQWLPLAKDEVLFRQGNGAARLRIPLTSGSWKQLRVSINDKRANAVGFTGARIEFEQPATKTIAMPLTIKSRIETPGHSKITVGLDAAHLSFATLRLHPTDSVFSRNVRIFVSDEEVARETVYRLALDGQEMAMLDIPMHCQTRAAEWVLDIENGDSPPLKIEALEAQRYPVTIAFYGDSAGRWQLYTGNKGAHAPIYDVSALSHQLRNANAVTPSVSALGPNPAFDKTAALPDTGESGAAIDLKKWAYRRPISTTERGVMQLELDTQTLARSATSFADLRLVQSGHQLPYLLQQPGKTRELAVSISAAPDEKRPSVSRWQLKLPMAGLPVTSLAATSTTPLFSRYLSLSEARRDRYGNSYMASISSASWDQKPGATSRLHLSINDRLLTDILILETDNGDNAPLQINNVTSSYSVVQLLFKTTDPAPIDLFYGNREASTPRYDLRLVSNELLAATPIAATLGGEEQLKPAASVSEAPGKGSPWLWAVLAVVVGGLLWLVAKLLPQPAN